VAKDHSELLKQNITNFKTIERKTIKKRPVDDRIKDFDEIIIEYREDIDTIMEQASRCQNCGIPFCHGYGCPVENMIPDWNELVSQDRWEEACNLLHSTNNLPEVTGRVCPAPCEEACTLNVGVTPVTICNIELAIVEKGFTMGYIKPQIPETRTDKKIAIIGSGPAGLAAAQQLCRMGHNVVLLEKDEKAGGYMRYGIPDYKLEKHIIDRRLDQMRAEGVEIKTGVEVGVDITIDQLKKEYDAVLVTTGSRDPRDLPIDGRELDGIHFATDYLKQNNMRVDGYEIPKEEMIDAAGKNVIVIGGGDTGSDCVGTSRRQGATSIVQLEILPMPPEERAAETPWPQYAKKMRTSTSHEEGCERRFCILSKSFTGDGKVEKLTGCTIEWYTDDDGRFQFKEIPGTEFTEKADLVLLAMGFKHTVHDSLITGLGLDLDDRGNVITDNYGYGKTSVKGVFAAGDASRGQSLVVWAIRYGREVAEQINEYLADK
jgi:glutamate synthase (NADPH/NADH) small chain